MNATKVTRIEPLNLTQNTAVGHTARTKPIDWYIYQIFTAGVTYWDAAPHPTNAEFPVEFVCAVTTPQIMVGTRQDTREEVRKAVLKHATDLKMID